MSGQNGQDGRSGGGRGGGIDGREGLIPKHGGYRKLKSFQIGQLVYDVTMRFCDRYIDKFSRTKDQMVQAARSGVQNIAEGSKASGTSKKTELKLTNVAQASLEELRLDYEDFLRQCWFLSLWRVACSTGNLSPRLRLLKGKVGLQNVSINDVSRHGGRNDRPNRKYPRTNRPLMGAPRLQRRIYCHAKPNHIPT